MRIKCLDDIVWAVNDSGGPNVAQLVGAQNSEVILPMFKWNEYFGEVTVKTALKARCIIFILHQQLLEKSF